MSSTTKKCSRVLANLLGFDILEHPPYSTDLAHMDFRVFLEIMGKLSVMRFEDATELCIYSSSYTSDWLSDIYAKWLQRHRKCIQIRIYFVENL